jgi:acetylglutamate kinase
MDSDVTTLIEALPYIREFRGETFVVRCAEKLTQEFREALCRDIAMLRFVGVKSVLVHPYEGDQGSKSGLGEGRLVNHQLVHSLGVYGKTAGFSGSDGAPSWLLSIDETESLRANADLILHVIDDYTPVVEAVAVGPDGGVKPVNPDMAAAKLAIALNAYKVILVSGPERVAVEHEGKPREVSEMHDGEEVRARIVSGPETKTSVEAGAHAISEGVRFAHIVRSDEPHGLLLELFTDGGTGTKMRSREAWAKDPVGYPTRGYTLW